jgi:hypothetical protein
MAARAIAHWESEQAKKQEIRLNPRPLVRQQLRVAVPTMQFEKKAPCERFLLIDKNASMSDTLPDRG